MATRKVQTDRAKDGISDRIIYAPALEWTDHRPGVVGSTSSTGLPEEKMERTEHSGIMVGITMVW